MSLIKDKHFFTVSEFAKLFRIHKKTLYHYDKIGLFKPEYVSENGYRYYSQQQTYDFHVLLALKDLRMSLEDTKHYVKRRTPKNMAKLLDNKVEEINGEIERLINLRDSISKKLYLIKNYADVSTDEIQVKYVEKQCLRIEPIDVMQGSDTNYMTWHDIFCEESAHHLNDYLYGQMLLHENLIDHNFIPSYILMKFMDEKNIKGAFIKPSGKYVIGRKNGKVLHSVSLYDKLMKYIDENNLKIIGNSYEFFVIDGTFASNVNDRILEIQIQVE